jgi:hypothetical protein
MFLIDATAEFERSKSLNSLKNDRLFCVNYSNIHTIQKTIITNLHSIQKTIVISIGTDFILAQISLLARQQLHRSLDAVAVDWMEKSFTTTVLFHL